MEDQTNNMASLFERAGDHLETMMDLYKLKTVDRASNALSSIACRLAICLFFFTVLALSSIGVALLIGESLGRSSYGFFIVAGFYFITGIFLYRFRDKWLKKPLNDLIIRTLLN